MVSTPERREELRKNGEMEKQKAFRIYGKVRELESMIGVPGLRIETFDKDLIFDDRLGSVTTDIDGNFEIGYGRDLSEKIAEIHNGKVEIGEDEAYTFVPFVYEKTVFAPEIFAWPVRRVTKTELPPWWWKGLPAPEILQHLEKVNSFGIESSRIKKYENG